MCDLICGVINYFAPSFYMGNAHDKIVIKIWKKNEKKTKINDI